MVMAAKSSGGYGGFSAGINPSAAAIGSSTGGTATGSTARYSALSPRSRKFLESGAGGRYGDWVAAMEGGRGAGGRGGGGGRRPEMSEYGRWLWGSPEWLLGTMWR
jgi:hypothetical protein